MGFVLINSDSVCAGKQAFSVWRSGKLPNHSEEKSSSHAARFFRRPSADSV